MGESGKQRASAARNERLRAALRENLRRRKAQARGREAQDPDAPDQDIGPRDRSATKVENRRR
jgi:hypothetical protein